jgi:hypothetical protein
MFIGVSFWPLQRYPQSRQLRLEFIIDLFCFHSLKVRVQQSDMWNIDNQLGAGIFLAEFSTVISRLTFLAFLIVQRHFKILELLLLTCKLLLLGLKLSLPLAGLRFIGLLKYSVVAKSTRAPWLFDNF